MSALENLKRIFEINSTVDERVRSSEAVSSLSELPKYLNFAGEVAPGEPLILESIKTEASNEFNDNHKIAHKISDSLLEKLLEEFEKYKRHVVEQREKIIPIQEILEGFNNEINELSSILSNLESKSAKLTVNSRLEQNIATLMNPMIVNLMIPPEVIKTISSSPINENWISSLRILKEKMLTLEELKGGNSSNRMAEIFSDSKALAELEESVETIKNRAVERIRNHIISQIKRMRLDNSVSSQGIQFELLKNKEAFQFLKSLHSQLAEDLKLAYIYTMSWYYKSKFAKYAYALQKLHIRDVDTSIVIGTDGTHDDGGYLVSNIRHWFADSMNSQQAVSSPKLQNSNVVSITEYLMSLDKRLTIAQKKQNSDNLSAMPSQIAETTPFGYYIEFVFNQWKIALVDNVIVEYLFMVDFFYDNKESFEDIKIPIAISTQKGTSGVASDERKAWSSIMFEPLFKLSYQFISWLVMHPIGQVSNSRNSYNNSSTSANMRSKLGSKSHITGTCDVFGILLIIRLIQNSQQQMKDYHIPILNEHLNSLLLLLWPQFTKAIDLNCDSMRSYLNSSSANHLKTNSQAPLTLTSNFAQFISGILKLCEDEANGSSIINASGEPISTSITRLRNDYENTITKLSSQWFGSSKSKATDKEVFLFNNYFVVMSILKNENLTEADAISNGIIHHFEVLCDAFQKK